MRGTVHSPLPLTVVTRGEYRERKYPSGVSTVGHGACKQLFLDQSDDHLEQTFLLHTKRAVKVHLQLGFSDCFSTSIN